MEIINYLKFDIGVQAFLNSNRVIAFYVDMCDSVWESQADFMNNSISPNISSISIDIDGILVTGLLDKGMMNYSSRYDNNFS